MKVELFDEDGNFITVVETHNLELSDDMGFNVDYLTEANDELPPRTAELRIQIPES